MAVTVMCWPGFKDSTVTSSDGAKILFHCLLATRCPRVISTTMPREAVASESEHLPKCIISLAALSQLKVLLTDNNQEKLTGG